MDLATIKVLAETILKDDRTGHNWKHALRVEKNALMIAPPDTPERDLETMRVACWVHDAIDEKIAPDKRQSAADIERILRENGATPTQTAEVLHIIQNLSYAKNLEGRRELSEVGQIVQDADRLDALGAIGIARAFYYGGHKENPLYDDEGPRDAETLTEADYRRGTSVLNHFYEKLLLLEGTMNTEAGRLEAEKRTTFMRSFLERFQQEISGNEL